VGPACMRNLFIYLFDSNNLKFCILILQRDATLLSVFREQVQLLLQLDFTVWQSWRSEGHSASLILYLKSFKAKLPDSRFQLTFDAMG
jgi:hypothetical protein